MNNDMILNHEGYKDPTAAAAIARVNPGEIWEMETSHGPKKVLVLSITDGVLQVLYVRDDLNGSRLVAVPGGDVDTRFVTFGFKSKLLHYVARCPYHVFRQIRSDIYESLQIPPITHTVDRDQLETIKAIYLALYKSVMEEVKGNVSDPA